MAQQQKIIEWFLRISLSVGFLSAISDRFGIWSKDISVWGNWQAFVKYTHTLLPFLSEKQAMIAAIIATFSEIFLGAILLVEYQTSLMAKISGFLILSFGISMALFINIKTPLDYSVFIASAGAFALSIITRK